MNGTGLRRLPGGAALADGRAAVVAGAALAAGYDALTDYRGVEAGLTSSENQ